MSVCPYLKKKRFHTRELAIRGAETIRSRVEFYGGVYKTLYPYRCPGGVKHWHLSSSRQGTRECPCCHTRQPAWFDGNRQEWVVYAHGECATQAVTR